MNSFATHSYECVSWITNVFNSISPLNVPTYALLSCSSKWEARFAKVLVSNNGWTGNSRLRSVCCHLSVSTYDQTIMCDTAEAKNSDPWKVVRSYPPNSGIKMSRRRRRLAEWRMRSVCCGLKSEHLVGTERNNSTHIHHFKRSSSSVYYLLPAQFLRIIDLMPWHSREFKSQFACLHSEELSHSITLHWALRAETKPWSSSLTFIRHVYETMNFILLRRASLGMKAVDERNPRLRHWACGLPWHDGWHHTRQPISWIE